MDDYRKRRGRPLKSSERRKSENLLVRVDPDEKQAFGEAAELAGIPLSSWVRERLRRIATEELLAANRTVPFITRQGSSGKDDA